MTTTESTPAAARRARTRSGTALIATASLLVAACASGDDASVSDTAPAEEPSTPSTTAAGTTTAGTTPVDTASVASGWLADASFAEDAVTELGVLHVDGIDTSADLGELELLMATDDGTVSLPLYLDDDGLTSVVPVFVEAAGEIADVEFRFVAADSRSGVIPMQVAALPAAAGGFDDAVEALLTAIDASAATSGSSVAELRETAIDEVAPELRPLRLVLGYVDDGTENDLESLPDALGLTADERERLDALVVGLGLIDSIGAPSRVRGFRAPPERALASLAAPAWPAPGQVGDNCTDGNVEADNAEQLIEAMAKGTDAIVREGGAEAQVLAGIQSIASVLGSLPLGAYGTIIGVIADMFSLLETYKSSVAGQYPTILESIDAGVTITEFNEDFKKDGAVQGITLHAASTGWDASALVATATKAITSALSDKLTGRLKDRVPDEFGKGVIDEGGNVRDTVTNKYIDAVTPGNYSVCPQRWVVDVSDTKYVVLERASGNVEADDATLAYRPTDLGTGRLRLRADAEVFSGRSTEVIIPIETKRLGVVSTPETVSVQRPGETVSITTRLDHADTTTLVWHSGPGAWGDGTGDDTNVAGSRPYVTPSDPDDYPYVMEIASTSTTGLRAKATDVRNDTVVFELAKIVVTPENGNVEVRKQLEYLATDRNGTPVDVLWSATGGNITSGPSSGAVYTAGGEPGTYTVTATLASNPTVSVTVPVVVGEYCLTGTWRVNAEHFTELVSDSEVQASPAGGYWEITIAEDRSFTTTLADFAILVEGGGVSGTMTMTGSQAGNIIATASEIQAIETTAFTLAVTIGTSAGNITSSTDEAPLGAEFVGGPYYCKNGQMFITSDGMELRYDRVD